MVVKREMAMKIVPVLYLAQVAWLPSLTPVSTIKLYFQPETNRRYTYGRLPDAMNFSINIRDNEQNIKQCSTVFCTFSYHTYNNDTKDKR